MPPRAVCVCVFAALDDIFVPVYSWGFLCHQCWWHENMCVHGMVCVCICTSRVPLYIEVWSVCGTCICASPACAILSMCFIPASLQDAMHTCCLCAYLSVHACWVGVHFKNVCTLSGVCACVAVHGQLLQAALSTAVIRSHNYLRAMMQSCPHHGHLSHERADHGKESAYVLSEPRAHAQDFWRMLEPGRPSSHLTMRPF